MDFYFLAGSETDPTEVARQYAEVVGLPAEVPYWSLGFHQCRYGYTGERSLQCLLPWLTYEKILSTSRTSL